MAAAIEFRCSTCGKLLRTGEENAGRPAACPACGDRVAVPAGPGHAPAGAAAPSSTTPAPVFGKAARPHRGGLVLAFGILSWVTSCFLFGVAAWALGVEDLRAMRAGEMDQSGESLTRAGMVLGIINVLLVVISLLGLIGFAGLAVLFS